MRLLLLLLVVALWGTDAADKAARADKGQVRRLQTSKYLPVNKILGANSNYIRTRGMSWEEIGANKMEEKVKAKMLQDKVDYHITLTKLYVDQRGEERQKWDDELAKRQTLQNWTISLEKQDETVMTQKRQEERDRENRFYDKANRDDQDAMAKSDEYSRKEDVQKKSIQNKMQQFDQATQNAEDYYQKKADEQKKEADDTAAADKARVQAELAVEQQEMDKKRSDNQKKMNDDLNVANTQRQSLEAQMQAQKQDHMDMLAKEQQTQEQKHKTIVALTKDLAKRYKERIDEQDQKDADTRVTGFAFREPTYRYVAQGATVTTPNNLPPTGAYTLSLWYRTKPYASDQATDGATIETATTAPAFRFLIHKSTGPNGCSPCLSFSKSGNQLKIQSDTIGGAPMIEVDSQSNSRTPETWHHVAVAHNRTYFRAYFDVYNAGSISPLAKTDASCRAPFQQDNSYLYAVQAEMAPSFSQLYDVRYYKWALEFEEIQRIVSETQGDLTTKPSLSGLMDLNQRP